MELCTGGSLFNLLDDPENSYGLIEDEFILGKFSLYLKNQRVISYLKIIQKWYCISVITSNHRELMSLRINTVKLIIVTDKAKL